MHIAYEENYLASFYLSQKLYNKAEPYILKKFEYVLIVTMDGMVSLNKKYAAVETYYSMAIFYVNMKDYKKAKEYVQKTLKTLSVVNDSELYKVLDMNSNQITAECYTLLGKIAALEGKNPNYWFKKTANFLEKNETKNNYPILNLYDSMSSYYLSRKDYKNAEKYALKMYSALPLWYYPDTLEEQWEGLAIIYKRLGKVYQNMGKIKEAKRMFLNLYSINEKIYGNYNPDTICSQYYVTETRLKLNEKEAFENDLGDLIETASRFLILSDINKENYKEKMDSFCD